VHLNNLNAPVLHVLNSHPVLRSPKFVFPSTPSFSSWCLNFMFPHQHSFRSSVHCHACHIPRPSLPPAYDPHTIFSEGYKSFCSLCNIIHPLLLLLRTEYYPEHPVLKRIQYMLHPQPQVPP